MSDTASQIIVLIADKLGQSESAVTPEKTFTRDLEMDSLDQYELIMDVEKKFSVSIPDEQLPKLDTVGALIHYVEEHSPKMVF